MNAPIRNPTVVDLFAGGGGVSEGISMALGRAPAIAINHCAGALEMHALNHPETIHIAEDVFQAQPWKVLKRHGIKPRIDLLWLSPDCTHHSRAKGGVPVDSGRRSLADVAIDWIRYCAPKVIILENVPEFEEWGPLYTEEMVAELTMEAKSRGVRLPKHVRAGRPIPERKGERFERYVRDLRLNGYRVEWRLLRGCDYGAPTIRQRLFLIARCDGKPIVWPEPTHGPGRIPYRTAAECIDWSHPMPSIFLTPEEAKAWGRRHGLRPPKRPLAGATMCRIAEGVRRYVLEDPEPFLLNLSHGGRLEPLDEPFRTLTATPKGGDRALVVPHITKFYGTAVGADARAPMPTATAGAGGGHLGLVSAFLAKHYGGPGGKQTPGQDLREPMATITASGQLGPVAVDLSHPPTLARARQVAAFLVQYYGSGGQHSSLSEPMRTIVTRARMGLVTVDICGEERVLSDIRLRMLQPRELARGMGFPDSYQLVGNKSEQIARIGNSVCPQVVEALVRAQMGLEPRPWAEAA